VEDAVEAAIQVLGISRSEADVKVINEGRAGVLGVFGGQEAEVEVSPLGSTAEMAKGILQELLDRAGFMTLVSIQGEEKGRSRLEIKGEDLGRIIGKEGAALDAIQTLTSAILSRKLHRRAYVSVDAAGYRDKRSEKLKRAASEAIEEALQKGGEVALPPMSARDRREVHLAVKDDGRASSVSRGQGATRRVIVVPQGEGEGGQQES